MTFGIYGIMAGLAGHRGKLDVRCACSLRKQVRRVGAFALLSCLFSSLPAHSGNEQSFESMPLPQLAASIAQTMAATTPKMAAPLSLKITSQDNVVEMLLEVSDADVFAKIKRGIATMQREQAENLCKPERLPFLKRGIVFQETIVGPAKSGHAQYSINADTCAALPKAAHASPETLTQLAAALAQSAKGYYPASSAPQLEFEGATARGAIVEERYIVPNAMPGMENDFAKRQFSNISRGWHCAKYGDAIRQGISFHEIYVSKDGKTLLDFVVDDTIC